MRCRQMTQGELTSFGRCGWHTMADSADSCPGGSGKRQLADGLANAMNHRQAPKTPLAAATRTRAGGICHRMPAAPLPTADKDCPERGSWV